jgi:PAS domain S-box-containing protein
VDNSDNYMIESSEGPYSENLRIKETERMLQHQLNQQKLIADISQVLNSAGYYSKLDQMLRKLGEHTGVSRVYIFEDSEDGLTTNNTFEWCNEGIVPQISELQGIPYDIIPSWKKILIEDGRVFSENILELPADVLAILEPQGIKSILVFPLYAEGRFIGFIGFDECTRNKEWRSDELDLLKLISNILSNAIERRIMLVKITEKQIRLELAVENAQEGIWDSNVKTGETLYDDTWSSMLGYTPEEFSTHDLTWENLLHPEDKPLVMQLINDHLSGKTDFFESTYRMRCKSGAWKWILDKGKVITHDEDNNPIRMIGKHTDLTEIKLKEEKLQAGLQKEKELNELKSRFVSNASHEFRTPLASILLISDVLKKYWSQLEPDQIEARIDKIIDQITHLSRIVDKVFEISKFQQGKTSFAPEKIDIVNLCNTIIDGFSPRVESKNRITFYSPMEALLINLDRRLFVQSMNNLISNALKYSGEDTFVHVKLSVNSKEVQLQIKDSGIGIPLNDQKHLFQPFFRASNTKNIPGNGLGLSIAKESITLHGGSIKVCSKPNKGTTFIICLPVEGNN